MLGVVFLMVVTTTTKSSNLSVVEAFQSTTVSSFRPLASCHDRQCNYNYNYNNKRGRIRRRKHQLFALVYGTDGKVVKDENQFGYNKISGGDIDEHSFLLESLRNYDSNNLFWTKIACAFAPPPHNRLTSDLVKEATLMKVGNTNFDIAIAVPTNNNNGSGGGDQLVQILVTVGFPQAIDLENIINPQDKLSALIQQVHVLDGHATDRLASIQKQQQVGFNDEYYYERIVIEKNWLERLQKEPTIPDKSTESQSQVYYPDWWTTIELPESSLELVNECKSLKSLINEDEFEDELRALFVQNYDHVHNDDDNSSSIKNMLVLRAAVSSIGSSGMYLQARVVVITKNENNNDLSNEVILAAAVPFESNPVLRKEFHTVDDVREGVLTLVESVAPMPKPTLPPLSSLLSSGGSMTTTTTVDTTTATTETTFTPFNEQVMKSEDDDNDDDDDEPPQGSAAIATDTIAIKNITATVATTKAEGDDVEEDKEAVTSTTVESSSSLSSPSSSVNDTDTNTDNALRRQQPKSSEEEAKLAAKYGAIEDLGERAYTILCDLNMVKRKI
ncbi:hypothetical protein FRACYDRAFT_236337 [Fragilariopsis cylindrus CCMP1102]|uniref:Uncharacterized protein n=1 Tax=Fragilariopsis cylindrus CCMP1102 TaxID=635003 RepID=A0A1E7FQ73_9STRA|nr:hypothetical protein FRACYDRAFT_236337 [Fragilariopsis cylindrus CCMP1102]|eukprot:OEU20264.1 hypothetical protein FRACYDRAFT_236337 [Fragilariopsis cylindrus CCMP1102]